MPAPQDLDTRSPDRPAAATGPARRLDLSVAQLLGSTAAAVTAAFLGSRLGVAGTLVGAALASVVSVVAGAIYTHSIRATRQRVRRTLQVAQSHVAQSHVTESQVGRSQVTQAAQLSPPPREPGPVRRSGRRRPTLRVAVASALAVVAVFAATLGIITGVEKVTGRDLSGSPGSLSVLGGGQAEVTHTVRVTTTVLSTSGSPAPTTSPTGSTTSSPVTSTGTSPAASASVTSTPTGSSAPIATSGPSATGPAGLTPAPSGSSGAPSSSAPTTDSTPTSSAGNGESASTTEPTTPTPTPTPQNIPSAQ